MLQIFPAEVVVRQGEMDITYIDLHEQVTLEPYEPLLRPTENQNSRTGSSTGLAATWCAAGPRDPGVGARPETMNQGVLTLTQPINNACEVGESREYHALPCDPSVILRH